MNETRYLNVDCILRSNNSLSGFLSSLKDKIFLLWDEPFNEGSFIGFETNLVDTKGPEEDIAEFLKLFNSPSLLQDLSNCQEKVFDIGFESGDAGEHIDVTINNEIIKQVSELGFSIKVRVYSVPPPEEKIMA